jgi:hypothetical protein
VEEKDTPDGEREEVDLGVKPALGVGVVLQTLFVEDVHAVRSVVLAVVVARDDHALDLLLNSLAPEPYACAGAILDIEEILVPERALSIGHRARVASRRPGLNAPTGRR